MKQNQVKKLIKLKLINLVSFLLTLILSMTLNAQYAQSQGFSHLDQAIAEQELLERLMNIDQMSLENLRAKLLAAEEDNEGAMAEDGTYITENGTYFIELSEEEANIITLFQDVADVFQYENAVSTLPLSISHLSSVNDPDSTTNADVAISQQPQQANVQQAPPPVAPPPVAVKKNGVLKRTFSGLGYTFKILTPKPVRTAFMITASVIMGVSTYKYLEENPDIDGAIPARIAINVSKEVIVFVLKMTNAAIEFLASFAPDLGENQSYQTPTEVPAPAPGGDTTLQQSHDGTTAATRSEMILTGGETTPPDHDETVATFDRNTQQGVEHVEQQPPLPSVTETEVQVHEPHWILTVPGHLKAVRKEVDVTTNDSEPADSLLTRIPPTRPPSQ